MTRYLENRDATMRRLDKRSCRMPRYEVLEDQSEAGLDAAIDAARRDMPT